MEKKVKEIKCFECKEIFFGSLCLPNKISFCPECKRNGFKIIKEKKTKEIKCCYCGEIFIGSNKLPSLISPCSYCRSKGLKNKISKQKQEEINLKRENTTLKNHGVKNVSQLESIQLQKEETCLKNHGYRHPRESPKIRKEQQETCLKNHGYRNPGESPKIRKKGIETLFKNHGVRNSAHVKHFKEKSKQTSMKNWNTEFPMQATINQEKSKKTMLENHNVEYAMQATINKEKSKKSMLENHNVEHALQSKKILENQQQTCLDLYNSKNYCHSKKYQIEVFENIKKSLKLLDLEFVDKEYQGPIFNHNWKCLKCNNIFQHSWQNIWRCPTCYPRTSGTSFGELEIIEFIKSLNISDNIHSSNRKIIKPLELDIYIPDKKFAIEFDGLRWHSEEFMSRDINEKHSYNSQTKHLYKTQKCEEQGIQLIHIFEDEWIFKQEIVKSRLKQILGVNSGNRIHARECIIKEISPSRKNEFLEKYHIQGKDNSNIKLGAFFGEDLVSVMTFSKGNISKGSKSTDGVWELNRFCSDSDFHIPGIAGKLLSHFKKNYEWSEIFSYADRRWSQGNLYEKLGFELVHITGPNYWYLKNYKRIHRFNLRKRPDEPKDISERILRLNEGYGTIWDCGSIKFQMKKIL